MGQVSLSCLLPLQRSHPLIVVYLLVFAEMEATSTTASGWLEVNLFLSHLILISTP